MKKPSMLIAGILISGCMFAKIIHVPGDYPTIQEGINAASNGDTVLVDEGTWYENIQFKGKSITVASHYIVSSDSTDIFNTIIDGSQATDPDSAACFMLVNGEDTTSVIAGFTITGGAGMMFGFLQAQHGGGIAALNAGGKIIHNIISGNSVSNNNYAIGGGISFITSSGQNWLVVRYNHIYNNHANTPNEVAMGGGIFTSINTIINNNIIENNSSTGVSMESYGGGIASYSLFTQDGILLTRNNLIRNNYADGDVIYGAGIMIMSYSSTIDGNTIENNFCNNDKYLGVGVFITSPAGNTYVTNNVFKGNTGSVYATPGAGGAISIWDPDENEVVVDANIFIDNTAKHGAGFYSRRPYNTILKNNAFAGNSASVGGGIGLYMHTNDKQIQTERKLPVVINNSFINNEAIESGGAIRITGDEGDGLLTFNNIFYENYSPYGPDIFNTSIEYGVSVYYSNIDVNNIEGKWEGENNFPGDPVISDDSIHLTNTSLCIDAGTSSLEFGTETYYCPDHDIDGEWRPMNASADIGADEYAFTGIPDIPVSDRPFKLAVSPNPSSGAAHLRYTIHETRDTKLEVYSSDGVVVKSQPVGMQQAGEYGLDLDLSKLPNGIYFIRLQDGEMIETVKIILIK